MKELFLAPVIAALLLGTLTQLVDIGEQASERTVEYADQALAALDCAYESRALTECAPGILSEDFTEEVERTQLLLDEIRAQS